MAPVDPRERVIIALDLPDLATARAMIAKLGDAARFLKIGHELAFVGGLELARELAQAGRQVFVDLKLHDIPNTVRQGVAQIADLGARFLTVHAYPQTLAAAAAASGSRLDILGVTVLTSMADADLAEAGYGLGVTELVLRRARQVEAAGCAGLVCSAEDIAAIRGQIGPKLAIVTPGIRPRGSASGDQKRVMTPRAAIEAGADYLVIGRPITQSSAPRAALEAILAEIDAAGSGAD